MREEKYTQEEVDDAVNAINTACNNARLVEPSDECVEKMLDMINNIQQMRHKMKVSKKRWTVNDSFCSGNTPE